MKTLFPVVFVVLFCLMGFSEPHDRSITISTSRSAKDEKEVKNFTGVVAGGPIDVVITIGNKEGLRFEGDADAIATLVAEVKGNILIIRPQTSWKSWAKKYEDKKITAHVSAKEITSLTMSGNGSISVSGLITASEFATTLSGSGSIRANVEAEKITGVISGSGSINISGSADVASVTLSGPGSFGSKSLNVKDLSARISGSGNINVKTNGNINALISGSGHVYYSGNPSIKKTVLGSGGVTEL